jgi:TrmH family RNA methyltransferase
MCATARSSESGEGLPVVTGPITSRRNPLIRLLRELHQGPGRRDHGLVLLEGSHLLEEALLLGATPDLVLATPDWLSRHPSLAGSLPGTVRLQPVSGEVLEFAATTRHPDGVLATLPIERLPSAPADPAVDGFVLALDRLQDPGNLGTLLRTALAAGVDSVWLAEGADPLQPKVLRASSGAALALPMERMSPQALNIRLERAAELGLQRVAAVVPAGAEPAYPGAAPVPYWQLDWTLPTVLLLGNEGGGLAEELRALADRQVTIPHSPAVESLNVAAAAALLLRERWRQRSGADEPLGER